MPMKKAIKKKWIKMLRSGRYPQTRGYLHHDGSRDKKGYCCLGVLALACGARKSKTLTGAFSWKAEPFQGTLSDALRDHVGLTSRQETKLITMNDDEDCSFVEIADYAEEHV